VIFIEMLVILEGKEDVGDRMRANASGKRAESNLKRILWSRNEKFDCSRQAFESGT